MHARASETTRAIAAPATPRAVSTTTVRPGVSNALLARVAQEPASRTLFRAWTGTPFVTYEPVNAHGTASEMRAELHGPQAYGSAPTVKPTWWPTAPPATKAWFEKYMVQGHLLNDNLGGPGNTLTNLTPLTKTGNSRHLHLAETHLKEQLKKGYHAEYKRARPAPRRRHWCGVGRR